MSPCHQDKQSPRVLDVAPLWPVGHLPRRGEIGGFGAATLPATLKIGESGRDI